MEWGFESAIMGECHCRDCEYWTGWRMIGSQPGSFLGTKRNCLMGIKESDAKKQTR